MTQLDLDFPQLQEICSTLDQLLVEVHQEMRSSADPDGLGVLDRGEAIIGLGFVACQNYLVARKGQRSKSVYDLGPLHGSQLHVARVVNETANYWKHHPEWPADVAGLSSLQRKTYEVLNHVGVWQDDYKVSNVLFALVQQVRFAPLLEVLDEWRAVLDPGGFLP